MKTNFLLIGVLVGLLLTGSCIEKYGKAQQLNVTTFKSEEEMEKWVQQNYLSYYTMPYPIYMPIVREPYEGFPIVTPLPVKSQPRFSETNVQVVGIDEPDIVKTDGEKIYFSNIKYYWGTWSGGRTKIIKAYPPEKLEVENEIDKAGKLLLTNNTLILLTKDSITGYNVSDKAKKIWSVELNGTLVSARLYNKTVYIVTKSQINYFDPCPIRPLKYNGKVLEISCNQIYHPTYPIYVDSIYTVVALDAKSGEVVKSTSFVGSSGKTVVYMSKNAIYISYPENKDLVNVYYTFMKENKDLFPDKVTNRVKKLLDYDISSYSKFVEINIIIDQYKSSLSKDERLKFENELWNRLNEYYDEHKRELQRTGIVKVSLNLDVIASGDVVGKLLNQFSIDEYEGYLRVATTTGFTNTTNDIYILDPSLNIVGSIKDYGMGEKIYAVRFLMDKGYVVTFKQTDPLFILDLSDPENPKISGELKIPGYSSYLHPIDKNLIIGIGKEGSNVKISLFNVSNSESPKEVDKYILREYWSEILETHHAFLIDKKHDVFFLPTNKGGYIFSYENNKIRLLKAVSISALRAVYIDDYMYIIGDNKIVVLSENTWKEIAELQL